MDPKGTKADFCTRIEAALRILNERDPIRRWFLYPGEQRCVEYDQMGRHSINRNPSTKELRTCKKISGVTKVQRIR